MRVEVQLDDGSVLTFDAPKGTKLGDSGHVYVRDPETQKLVRHDGIVVRLGSDYGGRVRPFYPDKRHLSGQHDQKTHGHGGGGGGLPAGEPGPAPSVSGYLPDNVEPSLALFPDNPAQVELRGTQKDKNARQVGARLEQEMTADEILATPYGEHAYAAYRYASDTPYTPGQAVAAALQDNWAETSGDHDVQALNLQRAAKEEFGLPGKVYRGYGGEDPTTGTFGQALESDYAANGRLYRSYLRAEYKQTQQSLRDRGVEEVTVYRGLKQARTPSEGPGFVTERKHISNPMSSWSASSTTAWEFSHTDSTAGAPRGVMLSMKVPASRVLSLATTSRGCLSEYEVLLLGGQQDVASWWVT